MNIFIPGYKIDTSPKYTGAHTLLYAGMNDKNKAVLIKVLKGDYPSPQDIAQFKHEYETEKLFENLNNFVKVYGFYKHENSYAFVMEKIDLPNLAEILEKQKNINIDNFLTLSIRIAKAIGYIHSSGSIISQELDITAILKASTALSSTIVLSDLLNKLMHIVVENAGAQKCYLLLNKDDQYFIEAAVHDGDKTEVLQSIKPDSANLPMSLINYIIHTKEEVVLDNARKSDRFMNDEYIAQNKPLSILVFPLLNHGEITGILYLENNLADGAFTKDRIHILNLLSSQIAISLQNATLYYQATHDPLTSLANRNMLYQIFSSSTKESKKNVPIAILLFDLDYFKKINDTLGHHVGDKVLLYISNLIATCIGKDNLAARLGDDEFVAMVKYHHIKEVTDIAENFLKKLNEPVMIEGHELKLSSSIGISLYPQEGENIADLLKKSDLALYHVKAKGKNQFQLYTAALAINENV